jgi:hypothetical protein
MRPLLLRYRPGAQTQPVPYLAAPDSCRRKLDGGWALVPGRAAPSWKPAVARIDDRAPPQRPCHRNAARGAAHQGPNGVAGCRAAAVRPARVPRSDPALERNHPRNGVDGRPGGGSPAA